MCDDEEEGGKRGGCYLWSDAKVKAVRLRFKNITRHMDGGFKERLIDRFGRQMVKVRKEISEIEEDLGVLPKSSGAANFLKEELSERRKRLADLYYYRHFFKV